MPIHGTNIVLDDPEVLEAWIAERKRRFPTSSRVEDKKRKMEEAVARGQLDLSEAGVRASKRHKPENTSSHQQKKRTFASSRKYGGVANDTGNDRIPDSGWGARSKVKPSLPGATTSTAHLPPPSPAESDDGNDQAPDIVSSKIAPPTKVEPIHERLTDEEPDQVPNRSRDKYQKKALPLQPKMPMHNPFASRPKLLRNVRFSRFLRPPFDCTPICSFFYLKYGSRCPISHKPFAF